jgi:hypothetical protein
LADSDIVSLRNDWWGRPVIRQSARLALTIGIALLLAFATGAALAAGSPSPVRHPAVHPAVGGLTSIVQVHVIADGQDNFSSDQLEITAPSGTSCANATAGLVVTGPVQGPRDDSSGPVTLYIGPGAEERYPAMVGYNAYDPFGARSRLGRWCPGTYTGEITYEVDVGGVPPLVTTTFHFRISATKHVEPMPKPAVAHDLKLVTVSPSRGHRGTIFGVRYPADAASHASGDVIDVDGPKHSACQGRVVRVLSEHANWTPGMLTAHIGPGAGPSLRWGELATTASPARDGGTGKPLQQWCPGTYNGTIFHERGPKFTVVAQFALAVAR